MSLFPKGIIATLCGRNPSNHDPFDVEFEKAKEIIAAIRRSFEKNSAAATSQSEISQE